VPNGAAQVACRLGGRLQGAQPRHRDTRLTLGALRQRDGRAAVTVLPALARLEPATLDALAALADDAGVRLSAARTLTIPDVDAARAGRLLEELAVAGFVTEQESGWWGLTACAGVGACLRARVDVRAAATARAPMRGPDALSEHWSACDRGCGRPPGAGLAITAVGGGVAVEDEHGERLLADVPMALDALGGRP
jgi:sulfite reductase beta subunit-like hemoprotein